MRISLTAIELDTSIQCRAAIDTVVVDDYAERMDAGADFPPVEVYGTKTKCWLGDGWHRVFAARKNGASDIEATLHDGGRADALKHALGANAVHGHRRSNADKRRCVEIALREFPKMSSRAVAAMCGVSNHMVDSARPVQLGESPSSTRTGLDGKDRPARRVEPAREPAAVEPVPVDSHPERVRHEAPVLGPPRDGLQFAHLAIMDLEKIRADDAERAEAFSLVKEWIDAREA